jgi:hypothetical protein
MIGGHLVPGIPNPNLFLDKFELKPIEKSGLANEHGARLAYCVKHEDLDEVRQIIQNTIVSDGADIRQLSGCPVIW